MPFELLGLLAASAGASYGWWRLQRRRERKLFDVPRDPDLEVVIGVAQHEAQTRGHGYLWPLHLLHGLVQDESFVAAIRRLDGDAVAFESHVQAELDKRPAHDDDAMHEGARVLGYTLLAARSHGRPATVVDLWARLATSDVARAAAAAATIEPTALLFVLAHGMPEPSTELAGGIERTEVHVVLRNDDYTTRELVVAVLREVFGLANEQAEALTQQTHEQGRAIVGRYKLAVARDKIAAARRRTREAGFPLWIGLEDC